MNILHCLPSLDSQLRPAEVSMAPEICHKAERARDDVVGFGRVLISGKKLVSLHFGIYTSFLPGISPRLELPLGCADLLVQQPRPQLPRGLLHPEQSSQGDGCH